MKGINNILSEIDRMIVKNIDDIYYNNWYNTFVPKDIHYGHGRTFHNKFDASFDCFVMFYQIPNELADDARLQNINCIYSTERLPTYDTIRELNINLLDHTFDKYLHLEYVNGDIDEGFEYFVKNYESNIPCYIYEDRHNVPSEQKKSSWFKNFLKNLLHRCIPTELIELKEQQKKIHKVSIEDIKDNLTEGNKYILIGIHGNIQSDSTGEYSKRGYVALRHIYGFNNGGYTILHELTHSLQRNWGEHMNTNNLHNDYLSYLSLYKEFYAHVASNGAYMISLQDKKISQQLKRSLFKYNSYAHTFDLQYPNIKKRGLYFMLDDNTYTVLGSIISHMEKFKGNMNPYDYMRLSMTFWEIFSNKKAMIFKRHELKKLFEDTLKEYPSIRTSFADYRYRDYYSSYYGCFQIKQKTYVISQTKKGIKTKTMQYFDLKTEYVSNKRAKEISDEINFNFTLSYKLLHLLLKKYQTALAKAIS